MWHRLLYLLVILIAIAEVSYSQQWKLDKETADHYRKQRNTDSAIFYYSRARQELKKDSIDTDTYLQVNRFIAGLYYTSGSFNKATIYYEEVRTGLKKRVQGINAEYASVCNALGASYQFAGKIDTAISIYKEVKTIRENLFGKDTSEAYAQSCNNLGVLYSQLGQYDLAEPLLLEAVAIRKKAKEAGIREDKYAITCTALAGLYRDMGQYDKAESFYIEGKEIRATFNPVRETAEYAFSCNILADLYNYMGKFDQAEPLYIEAMKIREKSGKNRYYGETCNNLGALYREMGLLEKSESLLLEAKEVYEKNLAEDDPSRIINLNNLGELYFEMKQYEKAEKYLHLSRSAWQKMFSYEHPYMISNADELIKTYWNLNSVDEANHLILTTLNAKNTQLEKVFGFTNETEKQLYLKNINGANDEYQSFYNENFAAQQVAVPYQISLLGRNLILNSLQKTKKIINESKDVTLINLYNDWVNVKQRLAQFYSRGLDKADTIYVKDLEQKAGNMEKQLVRRSSVFKESMEKTGWKEIQQHLKSNEIAIEFNSFRFYDKNHWSDSIYYSAIVLRKDINEPVFVPLFEKKQLDSILNSKGINVRERINQLYNSFSLYKLIWQPIEKYLQGITKIYFAPAGDFHRINLSTIITDLQKRTGEQYQFVQLLSTSSVTSSSDKKLRTTDKIIMYGDVLYNPDTSLLQKAVSVYKKTDETLRSVTEDYKNSDMHAFFEPLPASGYEVDAISAMATKKGFQTILYKGVKANEESVKSLNNTESSFVLHIATHGFFFPDPGESKKFVRDWSGKAFKRSDNPLFRSGLVLAGAENAWRGVSISGLDDGILTAYEISNLYLPKAKLVVLSACETGLGDIEGNEGVYGLQRAFKMAGADYLLMSLWDVPDLSSAEFMQLFYSNMFNNLNIPDAFYKAQSIMKLKYPNDPYAWAAWILIE